MRLKSIIHATLALAAAGALCEPAAARAPAGPRPAAPLLRSSSSATSASKACSASPRARSTTTCRSTSATGSTSAASPRRCARCTTPKFFRDVEMRRDGGTLVVAVLERPSIESFEIKGNKDIKTEDLQKSLRNVGLATGKTFDQSVLDEVKQYLTDQYFSRGKYAVRVDAKVEEVPGNKVKIDHRRQRRQARAHPPDQRRRQHGVPRRRAARAVRAEDAELAVLVSLRTTATRARRCRATWRSCARTTWTAATRISP